VISGGCYGQGAAVEIVAMGTIAARTVSACRSSTTHVAVFGRRGLDGGQWLGRADVDRAQPRASLVFDPVLRDCLSAFLYFVFRHLF
jgi:hypothetical protein